jgi:hypothetical protein
LAHSESALLAATRLPALTLRGADEPGGTKRKGQERDERIDSPSALRNCPSGLAWCAGFHKPEIIVKGLKQGHSKKAPLAKSASALCKRNLLATFLCQFPAHHLSLTASTGEARDPPMCYHTLKQSSCAYQAQKERLCGDGGPFAGWIRSPPELEQFTPPPRY